MYTRITDDDRTGNPLYDEQFHAMQENENWQNEIQVFWDITDNWSFVGGLFEYHEEIDQDLDFFNPNGDARYSQPANYGTTAVAAAGEGASRQVQMLTAVAVYGGEPNSTSVSNNSRSIHCKRYWLWYCRAYWRLRSRFF